MKYREIKVSEGQTIYDLAVRYYGSINAVDILLADNALTYDSDLLANQIIKIRLNQSGNIFNTTVTDFFEKAKAEINNSDFIKVDSTSNGESFGAVQPPIPKEDPRTVLSQWKVQNGQSIYDIVVQNYGSLEFTEVFLTDNALTYDDALTSGQIVKLRPELVQLAIDNKVINNADNIARLTGVLRIIVLAVGNEINGDDGFIFIDVQGGVPGYTFLWSNGSTLQNLTGLTTGTYSVTVTDAESTTASVTITISSNVDYSYLIDETASYVIDENGERILIA